MSRHAPKSALVEFPLAIALVVLVSTVLVGCSGGDSDTPDDVAPADASKAAGAPDTSSDTNTRSAQETPVQAIGSIIALYKARDFDTLFRTRYAEIDKAETEEQIQSLIDRYASRFEGDEALNEAIATYTSVLTLTPELTEDGTVATFQLDGGSIKLSKMPDGTWGFHL